MSQNNSITWVLFSSRGCGWIGPDTCIRTSRGNIWLTTGVTQSFASPSKPPRDTAPTATNLRRWGVSEVDPACIMCGKPAMLRHVLNGCPVALHQGRYTWRHNSFFRHPSRAEHLLGKAQHTARCTSDHCDEGKSEICSVRASRSIERWSKVHAKRDEYESDQCHSWSTRDE